MSRRERTWLDTALVVAQFAALALAAAVMVYVVVDNLDVIRAELAR